MPRIVYNKLVRDKIPSRINSLPYKRCSHKVIEKEEYFNSLKDKLNEELQEFNENPCVEELGDIYDVVRALIKQFGEEEFEKQRTKKIETHGGFEGGVFLEWVEHK